VQRNKVAREIKVMLPLSVLIEEMGDSVESSTHEANTGYQVLVNLAQLYFIGRTMVF